MTVWQEMEELVIRFGFQRAKATVEPFPLGMTLENRMPSPKWRKQDEQVHGAPGRASAFCSWGQVRTSAQDYAVVLVLAKDLKLAK